MVDLITLNGDEEGDGGSVTGLLNEPLPIPSAGLDIKPGECPNPFNRNSNGVLPVALVGTASFDVTQVDISTLQMARADGVGGTVAPNEGPPGPHTVVQDVATPFDGPGSQECDCHELEGDGIPDLSMKFWSQEIVTQLQLAGLPGGAFVELVVSGTLLNGTPFSASDCIVLVGPGPPVTVTGARTAANGQPRNRRLADSPKRP